MQATSALKQQKMTKTLTKEEKSKESSDSDSTQNKRNTLLNIFILLALIYTFYLVFGCTIQRRIVFPRHLTQHDAGAAENFPNLDIWHIDTEDGKTVAWFLPAYDIEPGEQAPAVIFAYGNAELVTDWAPMLKPYREAGIHVLLPEYRGYGFSDGTPSQKAITNDFADFYDRLIEHKIVDSEHIFFHGRSLGGGVVCALSRKRKPNALVLSSTFTSIRAVAGRFLFPPFLLKDQFDNLEALEEYEGPVLILHNKDDRLIPLAHAKKLKEAAGDATLKTMPGGHNNLEPYHRRGKAWDHILKFLTGDKLQVSP